MDSIETLAAEAALELYVEAKSNHLASLDVIAKAIGLPFDADPTHTYSHRSGEYGDYRFWWTDKLGNYWQYTNAPADHIHNDPRKGEPFILPDQPMPHSAPEFFTQDGLKRHMAVPGDVLTEVNPSYNVADPFNIWYESYQNSETGEVQYVYLDKDVKDDPSLYISYNLRIADSNIPNFRSMLSKLFAESGTKSKVLATVLMLLDQGIFDLDSLIEASVGDLVFIGDTVKLLNRKLVCDEELYNYLVSLKAQRPDDVSLFLITTATGLRKIGRHHISAVLEYFRISPPFLQSWHCSQKYVKTFSRLMAEGQHTDPVSCDQAAIKEVADAIGIDEDITFLINPQVRIQVMTNFLNPEEISDMIEPQDEEEPTDKQMAEEADENAKSDVEEGAVQPPPPGPPVNKSLASGDLTSDKYGVMQINSQLENYTSQETEFSEWLHKQPLHLTGVLPEAELWVDEEEEAAVEKSLPVRVSVVRALASRDDVIQGWSQDLSRKESIVLKSLEPVDIIYSSDLPRAVATALEIQSLNPGVTIVKTPDFRTANFGEYTGKPGAMVKSLVNKWEKGEALVRNGEDYQEFSSRVLDRFVSIVKDASAGAHVCIVTHELPALLTQARVLTWGTDASVTMKSLSQSPGSVSTYQYDSDTDEFTVISLNA